MCDNPQVGRQRSIYPASKNTKTNAGGNITSFGGGDKYILKVDAVKLRENQNVFLLLL